MKVNFPLEASTGVLDKIRVINNYSEQIDLFFSNRSYSDELKCLSIGIFCLSPKMETLFPPKPPMYDAKPRNYMYRGERFEKIAGTFEYELRLDYSLYNQLAQIKEQLANDIINSLVVISTCRDIKNLDFDELKNDFQILFKELGWL
jgi:hypothetical protein